MTKQINITAFHELLNSQQDKNDLLSALHKLTEIKDPKLISETRGPQPLGSWGGWAL